MYKTKAGNIMKTRGRIRSIDKLPFTTSDGVNLYALIGKRIYDRRSELGIKKYNMAKTTGIPISELRQIELGQKKFTMDTLGKISLFLKMDKQYFLTGVSNSLLIKNISVIDEYIQLYKLLSSLPLKRRVFILKMLNTKFKGL